MKKSEFRDLPLGALQLRIGFYLERLEKHLSLLGTDEILTLSRTTKEVFSTLLLCGLDVMTICAQFAPESH